MTPAQLLRWLIARSPQREGCPMAEIGEDHVDALAELVGLGDVLLSHDPPLAWVNPQRIRPKRKKSRNREWDESALPHDVDPLSEYPDKDSQPLPAMRRNGEPIFPQSWDEPSQLFAMGPTPWPPPGCEVEPRKYREHEHQYTITLIHDMVITSPACPICGHREKHANCLVCDAWPRRETPIRLEKWDPEEEAKIAKAEARKAAKEAEKKMKERIKAVNTKRKSA